MVGGTASLGLIAGLFFFCLRRARRRRETDKSDKLLELESPQDPRPGFSFRGADGRLHAGRRKDEYDVDRDSLDEGPRLASGGRRARVCLPPSPKELPAGEENQPKELPANEVKELVVERVVVRHELE